MPDLSSKSLAELNAMTKAQLIAAILEREVDETTTTATDGPHGQIRRVVETRERISGKLIKTRTVNWTYHPNGDVKTIVILDTDDKGYLSSTQTIRHEAQSAPSKPKSLLPPGAAESPLPLGEG